jgi:hypothetical protein
MSGSHSENQTTGKEVMISNQQKEKKECRLRWLQLQGQTQRTI